MAVTEDTRPTPADTPASHIPPSRALRVAEGAILGALIGLGLNELGLGELLHRPAFLAAHATLAVGVLGGALGVTRRGRWVLRAVAGMVVVLLLVVGYTPLAATLIRGVERQDTLRPAPAVVVLGGGVMSDGALAATMQQRAVMGYRVLAGGYAERMVLTRPAPGSEAWDPAVIEQMQSIGLGRFPVDVVGPVVDTRDEAIAVAALARERGWNTVILVTDPWHMRRAAAVFEHAGLKVICTPAGEGRWEIHEPKFPHDRIAAFRFWLRESVGYRLYHFRGWV